MRLFGKDLTFYKLLEAQAEQANVAARALHELICDLTHLEEHAERLARIEKDADELTHSLADRANRTFVTPIDKEDLRALSGALDDITDAIEAASGRIALYRLTVSRPDLEPIVLLLVEITRLTHQVVAALPHTHNRNELKDLFIRIHELENNGDKAFRQALQRLFDEPNPDTLMVIKWKEIYDRIEIAIDKCEDVATVVESVVVKYAA